MLNEEDFGDLDEQSKFKNPSIFIWGLFFLGLFLAAFGVGLYFILGSTGQNKITIVESESSKAQSGEVVIDVWGEVVKPGLYKVPAGSRVGDAVEAAGGFSQDADRSRVNLASKVSDGQKITIPKIGVASTASSTDVILGEKSTLVNINLASSSELEKLPGIGPVTAQKIIDLRPYNDVGELLSKKAVSNSVYGKIKELVTF